MHRRPFRRTLAALAAPLAAAALGVTADATPVGAIGSDGDQAASPAFTTAAASGRHVRLVQLKRLPDRRHHHARHAAKRHRPALASQSPHEIGRILAARRGWGGEQWICLDKLWSKESQWQVSERNASSGAYGIPQALPAEKMARAGSDWRTNPVTQIRWGLAYIGARYGSPCNAWDQSQGHGFY